MAKKPTPKNNQEPDIEDQKDIEALNHKTIEKHKLKKSNGLKYFIMIIFLLLCGGIITLLFSTKISSILPNGMAPVARFLSPSEALAIEKIQIYKLETDQRLNKIESIEHPNVELKIKQLRNESHRVSINCHRDLRSKDALKSGMDSLKGVGPVLKDKLLSKYKSFKRLKDADEKELIIFLGKSRGRSVFNQLRN